MKHKVLKMAAVTSKKTEICIYINVNKAIVFSPSYFIFYFLLSRSVSVSVEINLGDAQGL